MLDALGDVSTPGSPLRPTCMSGGSRRQAIPLSVDLYSWTPVTFAADQGTPTPFFLRVRQRPYLVWLVVPAGLQLKSLSGTITLRPGGAEALAVRGADEVAFERVLPALGLGATASLKERLAVLHAQAESARGAKDAL